jgi:hypothetical protein
MQEVVAQGDRDVGEAGHSALQPSHHATSSQFHSTSVPPGLSFANGCSGGAVTMPRWAPPLEEEAAPCAGLTAVGAMGGARRSHGKGLARTRGMLNAAAGSPVAQGGGPAWTTRRTPSGESVIRAREAERNVARRIVEPSSSLIRAALDRPEGGVGGHERRFPSKTGRVGARKGHVARMGQHPICSARLPAISPSIAEGFSRWKLAASASASLANCGRMTLGRVSAPIRSAHRRWQASCRLAATKASAPEAIASTEIMSLSSPRRWTRMRGLPLASV